MGGRLIVSGRVCFTSAPQRRVTENARQLNTPQDCALQLITHNN